MSTFVNTLNRIRWGIILGSPVEEIRGWFPTMDDSEFFLMYQAASLMIKWGDA